MHFREISSGTRSPAFATNSPENRHGAASLANRSLAAALVMLLTPSLAAALDHCVAKFRRKDGIVTVAAASVHGQLRWDSKERNNPEPVLEALCNGQGDTGINCSLSAANQVPPPAPPADCVVRLLDDASECLAYVRGCVPGERRVIPCLQVSDDGKEVIYQGCNVHIRNALGATATIDGTGNLIVGWNEDRDEPRPRGGSHNLVVGQFHSWTSYGGIVGGRSNTVSGEYSSVVGGVENVASGKGAAILGGTLNEASGFQATVSGGESGIASGPDATIGGGSENNAVGMASFVGGGGANTATGEVATVVGGASGEANGDESLVAGGAANLAIGYESVVLGGEYNVAGDDDSLASTVVGGAANTALASVSTVVGGVFNVASGSHAIVSGGRDNLAEGTYSSVSGGRGRTASGESDWVAGSLFEDE